MIVTALLMLGFGFDLLSLPFFLQDVVGRMSLLMTPLVLLFIGMAVRFQRTEMSQILQLLSFRSGLAFLLTALFLSLAPVATPAAILLAVVFPQSACSFWPFAHMSAVSSLESQDAVDTGRKAGEPTFNLDLALNTLALSLPFSTVIILGIFSFSNFFLTHWHTALLGLVFLFLAGIPKLITRLRLARQKEPASQLEAKLTIRQLVED
ncbi:MAG: hypothetical protein R2824_11475 [Saprospiraceae bacterium]